jgi:hypothetical protein
MALNDLGPWTPRIDAPDDQAGRAEALMLRGDQLLEAGDLDGAHRAYSDALDDGGKTVLNPRTGLLAVALERGEDPAGLLADLMALSRCDDLVIGDYVWIAESLEAAGHLKQAMRWFTIPLRDIQPGDVDIMPPACVEGRFRVRRALELPIDAYDESHELLTTLTKQYTGQADATPS